MIATVAFLLVAAPHQGRCSDYLPELDREITVTERAAPLSKVLAGISEKSGVTVRASSNLRDRVVVAHARAKAGDLIDRLAQVTFATVERRGTELVLSENRQAISQQKALLQKRRIAELGKAQAQVQAELHSLTDESVKERQSRVAAIRMSGSSRIVRGTDFGKDQGSSLAWPVLLHYLASIRTEELASVDSGARVVFATKPTAQQRPLPAGAENAVASFVKEFNREFEELRKDAVGGRILHPTTFNSKLDVFDREGPVEVDGVKILLIIDREPSLTPTERLLACDLIIVDGEGRLLARSRRDLELEEPTPRRSGESSILKLSLLSAECFRAAATLAAHRQVVASTGLRDFLSKPDQQDPLSLGPSELLENLAEARHEQLVAWLPDASFSQLATEAGEMSVSDADFIVSSASAIQRSEADGWLQVSPVDPLAAATHAVDRKSLRALTIDAGRGEPLALRSVFTFLVANPGYSAGDNIATLVTELVGGPEARLNFVADIEWERFVAQLADSVPDLLTTGLTMPIESLPPDRQETLAWLLYNGRVPGPTLAPENEDDTRWMARHFLATEPTEVFPDGLPMRGAISVQVTPFEMLRLAAIETPPVVPAYHLQNLSPIARGASGISHDTRDIEAVASLKARHFAWIEPIQSDWCWVKVRWSKSLSTGFRIIGSTSLGNKVKRVEDLPSDYRSALSSG